MSKKEYTFEDWKAGTIRQDYVNNDIEGFNDQKLYGIGYLPQQLHEQGFITDEEHSKIEDAQKETFDKGVRYSVNTFFNDFKKELDNAFKPAELIETKIKRLKYELEDASYYTLHQVYTGEWSKIGAGYKSFKIAKNPDEMGLVYLHNMITTPAHNTRTVNHVYVSTIKIRFIEKLENLLESKYSNSNSRSYGQHQQNRDWIIEKFEEQESNHPSQNKTAEKVKKLYKEKFGLKIGKSTILRFNDRV